MIFKISRLISPTIAAKMMARVYTDIGLLEMKGVKYTNMKAIEIAISIVFLEISIVLTIC